MRHGQFFLKDIPYISNILMYQVLIKKMFIWWTFNMRPHLLNLPLFGSLLSISDFTAATSTMFCPSDDRSLNVKVNGVCHFGGLDGAHWVI